VSTQVLAKRTLDPVAHAQQTEPGPSCGGPRAQMGAAGHFLHQGSVVVTLPDEQMKQNRLPKINRPRPMAMFARCTIVEGCQ
jgi:hypothetical protein